MSNGEWIDGVVNYVEEKVKSLSDGSSSNRCIYWIPTFIQKGSEECYVPSRMYIGRMCGRSLESMEYPKWIYLKYFLQHPSNANRSLKQYYEFVRSNHTTIDECYDSKIEIQHLKKIVVEAAFIVYLLISDSDMVWGSITIPKGQQGLMPHMTKDLFLLHNQLPFFVLQKFFDMAFGHANPSPNTFIHMILNNIISFTSFPGFKATRSVIDNNKINDASTIKHLLDLLWMCCCSHSNLSLQDHLITVKDLNEQIRYPTYPKTAKNLSNSGVKFEVIIDSDCPLNITSKNGKLMIPELVLDNESETYFRNLLYFEQCHYSNSPYINDYILFFDKLIDTVEDVHVLQEAGILKNNLGSDKNAVRFFSTVTKNTLRHQFYYSKVSEDVNAFADNSWNQSIALLKKRYFGHPWAAISVIGAFLLFILTLLQTIASFTK